VIGGAFDAIDLPRLTNGCQMNTTWKYLALCGHPSVSISSSFSVSLTLVILRPPTLPSIRSTLLMYIAELMDATQTRNTQVKNDKQTLR
jgi:hypothetical protein